MEDILKNIDPKPQSQEISEVFKFRSHIKKLEQNNFSDPIIPAIEKRFKNRISEKQYLTLIEKLSNGNNTKEDFQKWFKQYLKSSISNDFDQLEVSIAHTDFSTSLRKKVSTHKVLFKI